MKKRSQKFKIAVTTLVVVVALLAVLIAGLYRNPSVEVIQGQVECSDYRVSSKMPGRVLELRAKEGDRVAKGDTLAILDLPDIEAKLSQATAAFEAASSQQQKAVNGSRKEQIHAAHEQWQKAKAGTEIAQKTYQRMENLFNQGVVAEQKRDEARAQYQAAVATEKATKSQYDMAVAGTRDEDITAAAAQAGRARAVINEVRSYVREGVLVASAGGVVTEVYPEVGELVGSGAPIMNVATDDLWFTFNIREDLLPGLSVGVDTTVFIPAIGKSVKAQIYLLKDVGSFAVWKATKALDRYDLKTFEVQARPLQPVEGLRAGMSVIMK